MRRNNNLNGYERTLVRPAVPEKGQRLYVDCLRIFLNDAKLRNVRPATLRYYEREIQIFHREMELEYISEMTEERIKNRIIEMKDSGLAVSTINTRLRAIRAFYKHLHEYKLTRSNISENIKLLRDREPIIETYTNKQVQQLLAKCDLTTFVGVRDYTIFYLLYDTGVRLSEMVGIDVADVHFSEGVIKIRNTKNGFERFVPLQHRLAVQLASYIKLRGVAESKALFVTLDGTRISNRQTQGRFSHYGHRAGFTNMRNSPHTMRHTFAKNYIQNGGGAFDLMRIMGHTSMEMTKRYVQLFGTELSAKHKEASPLENLFKGK